VWLQVNDAVSIANLKVETANELSDAKGVTVKGFLANPTQAAFTGTALVELCAVDGAVLHQQTVDVAGAEFSASFEALAGLALWELDSPVLYVARVTLNTSAGTDQHSTRFGFRTARFTTEGFSSTASRSKSAASTATRASPTWATPWASAPRPKTPT